MTTPTSEEMPAGALPLWLFDRIHHVRATRRIRPEAPPADLSDWDIEAAMLTAFAEEWGRRPRPRCDAARRLLRLGRERGYPALVLARSEYDGAPAVTLPAGREAWGKFLWARGTWRNGNIAAALAALEVS